MEAAGRMSESDESYKRPALSEDEYDHMAGYEIEEDMVEEVMKRLEEEINGPGFVPYSSCSFVTINGNEESCGPSFSDSASTQMASIDMGGISISELVGRSGLYGGMNGIPTMGSATWVTEEDGSWQVGKVPTVTDDVEESDDEWLSHVLSGPDFEFEEGFGL
ncbi:uncharacterized protein LOC131219824 [Magnolia sinica]|uniref:uncharacterized protein LOC131219824 n=1 Tax=Magnolia sinica TaxID=86752 RepID=UPI00265A7342|nr:uncharacterized protein LOC131219824 [Magnolia sinica]